MDCRADHRPQSWALTNLIVGIVGAFIGGFLVSSLLGFQYAEGSIYLPS
jgi:uncharacterized membrane protein YeaQ/YmgE (transglycosylase-associated protein family)